MENALNSIFLRLCGKIQEKQIAFGGSIPPRTTKIVVFTKVYTTIFLFGKIYKAILILCKVCDIILVAFLKKGE